VIRQAAHRATPPGQVSIYDWIQLDFLQPDVVQIPANVLKDDKMKKKRKVPLMLTVASKVTQQRR
jgi:hypothetical protein